MDGTFISAIKTWGLPFWDPAKWLGQLLSNQTKKDSEGTNHAARSMTEQVSAAHLPDCEDVLSGLSDLRDAR